MALPYAIVPISVRTGRISTRPRRGSQVLVGVRGPKGGVKLLSKQAQNYYKSDFIGLNRAIEKTTLRNFVVYEQRTNKNLKDKKGKNVLLKSGKTKKQVKITFAKPQSRQKPRLYLNGNYVRDLDFGYKTGNYKRFFERRKFEVTKINQTKPVVMSLKGPTIKSALRYLQIAVKTADIFKQALKRGLYYNVFIKIKEPGKPVVNIPAFGSYGPEQDIYSYDGFKDVEKFVSYMLIDGKRRPVLTQQLQTLANMYSKIAYSIRRALKDVGYRFTTLATLDKIEAFEKKQIKILKKQKADPDKIERAEQALHAIKWMGMTHASTLNQITPKTEVTLYINFTIR